MKLKKCKCGADPQVMAKFDPGGDPFKKTYYIECQKCGEKGPEEDNDHEAVLSLFIHTNIQTVLWVSRLWEGHIENSE